MYAARALWCLTAVTGLTLLLLPLQLVLLLLRHPLATTLPVRYHRGVGRILGLDVRVLGTRAAGRSVLYVVNHSSWLDIVVLSTVLPGRFVAKKEVAKWPVVGIWRGFNAPSFVSRDRHGVGRHSRPAGGLPRGRRQSDLVSRRYEQRRHGRAPLQERAFRDRRGADRRRLAPRTAGLARYTRLNGMPLGRHMRPFFTWYGDVSLGGHLWRALGLGPLTAVVQMHPPMVIEEHASRKEMAAHCQSVVAAASRRARGRGAGPVRMARAPRRARRGGCWRWSRERRNLDSWPSLV